MHMYEIAFHVCENIWLCATVHALDGNNREYHGSTASWTGVNMRVLTLWMQHATEDIGFVHVAKRPDVAWHDMAHVCQERLHMEGKKAAASNLS